MPAETSWMTEGRITYTRVYGDMHCAELAQAGYAIEKYLHANKPPLHHIIDAADIGAFPLHASHYRGVLDYLQNTQYGWVVVVSAHPLMTVAIDVVVKVTNLRLHLAQSLDEALLFLADMDDSFASECVSNYETVISKKYLHRSNHEFVV